ncbi:carbon monoxide dehydrogenase subunit G [Novosphingobium sp. RD2P27]|uniref:Carbon monoxide dehydrogenase subunit G n=1 Tax=Novosphingobium kalidii TaxID=3230299 RepID=A0ABV2D123_9SPHN
MRMTGEQTIAAERSEVWNALNDPAVLAQCIPGCQSLEREGENRFVAVAEIKIGPIGARFKGHVELTELNPPSGYRISGSGNAGIAGTAKGGAKVRLSDAPGGGTLVTYDVDAEVGGRMAQLGGPIIDATAKNLTGKFFARFNAVVSASGDQAGPVPVAEPTGDAATASVMAAPAVSAPAGPTQTSPIASAPAPLWSWVVALVLAVLTGFMLGRNYYHGVVALMVAILVILSAAAGYEAGRRGGRT